MEFKAFLLDIDYETINGKANLRLFLRDSNGKKRVVYDDTFSPYFYVLPGKDPDTLKKDLLEAGAVDVEVVERKLLKKDVIAIKVFANHPQEVPKLRERIKKLEGVDITLEYDIPFARRYMIDRQIKPFQWYSVKTEEKNGREMLVDLEAIDAPLPQLKILALDIEVYNPKGAPRPEKDPIIMISLAGSDGYTKLLTWKSVELPFVEVVPSERKMLRRLEEILNSSTYDVIAGYNTDSFDFPYIKKRLKALNMDFLIEGKKIEIRGQKNLPEAKIRGLAHVDLYPIIRRNVKLNSYILENVVLEILGEEKHKVEKIWEYWDAGGDKLRELATYALDDAVVTLKLAQKFLPLYMQLSYLIGQSLQDVSRFTAGQMVEWYLMAVASQSKELVPNKPKGEEVKSRLSESYVGGYVKEPEKGIVEDIAVFDFRSLYPSIIVTHNIDPATLIIGNCTENRAPGLEYCFSRDIRGFIPQILEDLIKRRSEIKKKLKSCQNEIEKKMLDVSQHALKILANSFYGYMGYPRARWYKKECAESVAAFARHYIKKVMKIAEKEFKFRVVYGDTDSLFIVLPEKEKAYEFLNYVNRSMPGIIELELEGFYKRGLFVTKKRYALLSEDDKIIVKGLELVRRDWAPIAKKTQKKILEIILKENDAEKAARYVRDVIENIRKRNVTLEDMTIYTQITKKIESYEGKEPHVGAAKKLREAGIEVVPGMIIGYIVGKGTKKISDRTIPVELAKIEDYDPEYYIENQIMPAVLRIFESLGYKKDFLKSGIKQKSLLSF